jgi:8-amino-7-oxononanoate synthase
MVRAAPDEFSHAAAPSGAMAPIGPLADSKFADSKPRRRSNDTWLDSWSSAVSDLARLSASHPMMDAVIEEQRGRQIRVGDQWLSDFASCNYLGFDLDEEIIAAVPEHLARWGTHPSWSRLLGSPRLYPEIEEQMTELLDCEDVLLLPTITLIHSSVIPILAGHGTVFLDSRAHKTIYDGCMYATSHGATVQRFQHDDWEHVDVLLRASNPNVPRLIVLDGVNSMTGNAPDVAGFARVAREHDALLYIDDAHGFGVVGERSADELCDYGLRGNSIMRHLDVDYENVVLVGGFSKAYSSLLAFLALPTRLKDALKVLAPPYLYSGPSPVASLSTALSGLEVNRTRGDQLRHDLWRMSHRVVDALAEMSIYTPNRSGYPLIEIPLADDRDIDAVGRFLFDNGIYVTLAAYPLVPKHEVGFRVQVTAANTDEEIEHLIATIRALTGRFQLARPARTSS